MSEASSPYQAPERDVVEPSKDSGEWGSVEKALAGELEFGQVFSDAWALTTGAKTKILIAMIVYFAALIVVGFGSHLRAFSRWLDAHGYLSRR